MSEPTCIICRKPIKPIGTWKDGHNAEPIIPGRCCQECFEDFVIPRRIRDAKAT